MSGIVIQEMEVKTRPFCLQGGVLKKRLKKLNREAYESLKKQHEMFMEKVRREPPA